MGKQLSISMSADLFWRLYLQEVFNPDKLNTQSYRAVLFGFPEIARDDEWWVWGLKTARIFNDCDEIIAGHFEVSRGSITTWPCGLHEMAVRWLMDECGLVIIDTTRCPDRFINIQHKIGQGKHLMAGSNVSFHWFDLPGGAYTLGAIVEFP